MGNYSITELIAALNIAVAHLTLLFSITSMSNASIRLNNNSDEY